LALQQAIGFVSLPDSDFLLYIYLKDVDWSWLGYDIHLSREIFMNIKLGELLVRERIITTAQLAEAAELQKKMSGRLGDALVSLGHIDSGQLEHFFRNVPPLPRKVSDTGLSQAFLMDLLLKIAYFETGVFTLQVIAEKICLPIGVVGELTQAAKAERLVMVRSANGYGVTTHTFELTELGTQRAERALRQCEYAGAAPVPLTDYTAMVFHQTVRQIEIDAKWVRNSLSQLVLGSKLLEQIGPAFNSGRSIFLYGPPGTGKSSIAEGLARSLSGEVYIPYAVEVDGHVLSVFDPAIHVKVGPDEKPDEKQLDREAKFTHDPRWLICQRPMAMVGGELDIGSLDLDYDPVSKFYEAPIHMKAANGVFILDDFGRQQIAPRLLLNRWIVPLERGTDFLELHTGKKFEVPFDQITIFCTNLKPSELVDEAFLRRIRHKIMVGYQTEEEFLETLRQVCKTQGMGCENSMAEYLLETYYRAKKRPLVGSHPRDLVDQIVDRARFKKIKPELNREAIDAAAANYFVEL